MARCESENYLEITVIFLYMKFWRGIGSPRILQSLLINKWKAKAYHKLSQYSLQEELNTNIPLACNYTVIYQCYLANHQHNTSQY